MAVSFKDCLVIGISSRALFDLHTENEIFEQEGLSAYAAYQREHETDILPAGSGFPLVKALLKLNELSEDRLVEVIIMSRNSADTSLRVFASIEHYGLDITRAALAGGNDLSPYLDAFAVDLFLSADGNDVQMAVNNGIAAGQIYTDSVIPSEEIDEIRIAFDGDAVLFSDEAERIYQEQGLEAFSRHEHELAHKALPEGPFAKFLKTLSHIQDRFEDQVSAPIRTALVTARNAPAHERVIRTLREWNVRIDEAFFLGGMSKRDVLQAFGAHIFFDDQTTHLDSASTVVPSARVPYVKDSDQ